jgi:hypothetical protein
MIVEPRAGTRFPMRSLLATLKLPGRNLLGRPAGERALALLRERLTAVPSGSALTLDFEGVAHTDASFPDATIITLAIDLQAGKHGDRFLVLDGANDEVVANIRAALAQRHEAEKRKLALVYRRHGRYDLVGHIEANLREAWDLVRGRGELTARALADHLGLEINTAGTRLLKLHAARLLARREEISAAGRQHVYTIPG